MPFIRGNRRGLGSIFECEQVQPLESLKFRLKGLLYVTIYFF